MSKKAMAPPNMPHKLRLQALRKERQEAIIKDIAASKPWNVFGYRLMRFFRRWPATIFTFMCWLPVLQAILYLPLLLVATIWLDRRFAQRAWDQHWDDEEFVRLLAYHGIKHPPYREQTSRRLNYIYGIGGHTLFALSSTLMFSNWAPSGALAGEAFWHAHGLLIQSIAFIVIFLVMCIPVHFFPYKFFVHESDLSIDKYTSVFIPVRTDLGNPSQGRKKRQFSRDVQLLEGDYFSAANRMFSICLLFVMNFFSEVNIFEFSAIVFSCICFKILLFFAINTCVFTSTYWKANLCVRDLEVALSKEYSR